jgi:hypothetical protein
MLQSTFQIMEGIPYIVGQVNECLRDKKKGVSFYFMFLNEFFFF